MSKSEDIAYNFIIILDKSSPASEGKYLAENLAKISYVGAAF